MSFLNHWRLGVLLPLAVGAMAVVDVGERFIPLASVSIRAQEPALRYPWRIGPFQPDKHYDIPNAYGDLVGIGNLPLRYRHYRRELFTTDDLGFHNPYPVARPIDMLLIGSSFVTGHGLSDDEILSVQVHQRTGKSVYNAGFMRLDLKRTLRLLDALKMTQGIVVMDLFERGGWPEKQDMAPGHLRPMTSFGWRKRAAQMIWDGFWGVSYLDVKVEHVFQWLERNRLLPYPYPLLSTALTLRNGQEMIFYNKEIEIAKGGRTADLEGIRLLKESIQSRGLEFRVLLIPTKYTVYAPFLAGSSPTVDSFAPLNKIRHDLNDLGVKTLDIGPCLAEKAKRLFAQGQYIYLPDDTHWNTEGSQCGVDALASLTTSSAPPASANVTSAQ